MKILNKFMTAEEAKANSNKSAQSFDKEKITITKYGKTYNLYDSIQAAREDTEIYPTLEKYGNLQTMERKEANGVYVDMKNILSLQESLEKENQLKELFEQLPSKDRNIFNNDYYNFKQNGVAYYQKKVEEEIKAKQKVTTNEPKQEPKSE